MHIANGTTIIAALAGLAASTAVSLSGPQKGSPSLTPARHAGAENLNAARVRLADGDAYLDKIQYGGNGEIVAFTVRVGAPSRLAGRFVSTLPASIGADHVRYDVQAGAILIPYGETALLASQADAGMALGEADLRSMNGAMAVTDRGHRFGHVDSVVTQGGGAVLMVRLAGAGGGLQPVPEACARIVRETGLVIVRTCNLAAL